jgi:opacity protein-like surface antigen
MLRLARIKKSLRGVNMIKSRKSGPGIYPISSFIILPFFIFVFIHFFLVTFAYSRQVTLACHPNTDPDLGSYVIYYKAGIFSESYHGTHANQGASGIVVGIGELNDSSHFKYSLTGLEKNKDYYFVVTLFDEIGLESTHSNEVFHSTRNIITRNIVAAAGDVAALSNVPKGFFDIENDTAFRPFLGVGLGFTNIEKNGVTAGGTTWNDRDDTVFAYQFIIGLAFAATERINMELGYRYFGTDDLKWGNIEAEYGGHNILFGVRFSF